MTLRVVMRITLILLNLAFAAALITSLSSQPILAIVFLLVALGGAGLGIYAPAVERIDRLMRRRWMAFAPIVWFLLISVLVLLGNKRIDAPFVWSALLTWTATIFFWMCAYWGIQCLRRTFRMDLRRRQDWRVLVFVTTVVCAFALLMPWITVTRVVVPHRSHTPYWEAILQRSNDAPGYFDYVAYFNPDAYAFVDNSGSFLVGWSGSPDVFLHRPTYFLFTAQLCRVLSVPFEGYASGSLICADRNREMVAFWLVNLGMAYFSILAIYELVRHYLDNARVARTAALLSALSGFTLYFFAILATDYAELFIAIASLWMIHRLFLAPRASWSQIAAYGIIFGLLLLLKLNAAYLIFGILLAFILLRPRLLAAFTLFPALVYTGYRVLMLLLSVPYTVTETGSQWKTVTWLLNEWLPQYGWFEKMRSLTLLSGQVLDKTAFLFGLLLFIGVFVMILNARFPRRIFAAGWLLFIAICAWMPIFFYSYIQHTVALMPFIYGAVALGAEDAAARISQRIAKPELARLATGLILMLPLLHNVILWVTWAPKDWINFG